MTHLAVQSTPTARMSSSAGRVWSDNTERVNTERGSEPRHGGNWRRWSRKYPEMDTAIHGPRTTRTVRRSLPPQERERLWSRGGSSCGQSSGAPILGGQSDLLSGRSNNDGSSRMRVGVRVRPAFLHEVLHCKRTRRSGGYHPALTVCKKRSNGLHSGGVDEDFQEVDINNEESSEREGEMSARSTTCPKMVMLRMMNGRQRCFAFDEAFDAGCPQQDVYQSLAAPVVGGVLDGLHGLIMAYGQTASGKSHTMGILDARQETPRDQSHNTELGSLASSDDHQITEAEGVASSMGSTGGDQPTTGVNNKGTDPGIIPRALSRVFEHVGPTSAGSTNDVSIKVSLLQIYNETVQDLLTPTPQFGGEAVGLNIREDPSLGFFVEGLREYAVYSQDEAAALINLGLQQRATARTAKNDLSSRSHTVLTIALERRTIDSPLVSTDKTSVAGWSTGNSSRSKLVLVDLAGSERAGRRNSCGLGDEAAARLREAGYINGSLSALGNVVAALGRAELDRPHIPFRDSKLTRILADSLGGDANTALIATVGPAPQNQAESLSTLVFASRCMRVRSAPVRHEEYDQTEETLRLQAQLSSMQREFCRREALQQSRYETVITRLAQELDYVRTNAPIEDISIGSPKASLRSTPSTKAVEMTAPHVFASAPGGGGRDRSCGGCGSPDGRTDGTESSEEDAGRAAASAGRRGKPSSRGGVLDALNSAPPPPAAEKAVRQGFHEPSESGAWDVVDVALQTLQRVERKGASIVRQAKYKQLVQPSQPPTATATPSCARVTAGASHARGDHFGVGDGDCVLHSIERCRKLCEGHWDEAESMLAYTMREKLSLQQKLQAESLERLRRESQVQRLHGALRHVLADADSLDCLHPTPLGTPTKPTGLCEADRALPLPCDSTVTILEGGKLAPSGDVPTIAWDK